MIVGRVFGLYELNLIIRSLQIVHQVIADCRRRATSENVVFAFRGIEPI